MQLRTAKRSKTYICCIILDKNRYQIDTSHIVLQVNIKLNQVNIKSILSQYRINTRSILPIIMSKYVNNTQISFRLMFICHSLASVLELKIILVKSNGNSLRPYYDEGKLQKT